MSTTIVTMYFNLKELQDTSKQTRPLEFYLKNGRGTLELDNPMIIFCDSVTKPFIKSLREELSNAPTVFIERNISSYDYYNLNWSIIRENRSKSIAYSDPNGRNTASYLLMGMFKIMALKIAKDRNDFDSSHFLWIDFGCSHVVKDTLSEGVKRIIANPRPKIAILYIHYRSKNELKDMEPICNAGTCGIATTIFSAEATYINRLYSCMWAIFYEKLSKGIGHTDETVFTYCYDRHPELFSIYYGDYYSTASNYHNVINNYYSVKNHFIMNAISTGRLDLAKEAAKNVKDSLTKGLLVIPVEESKYIDSVINS